MKTNLFIAVVFAIGALTVQAQEATGANKAKPKQELGAQNKTNPMTALQTKSKAQLTVTTPRKLAPNQTLTRNGTVVSGVLVHVARTDNPLQLINPFAPARYGNAYDNTAIDPVTGKATGIKVFSVELK